MKPEISLPEPMVRGRVVLPSGGAAPFVSTDSGGLFPVPTQVRGSGVAAPSFFLRLEHRGGKG